MTLIEKLEAATGPDRGLDWDIFCLVQPDRLPFYEENLAKIRAEAEDNGIWAIRADAVIQGQRDLVCSRYTSSIDAAMTLVPEGWRSNYFEGPSGQPHQWKLATIKDGDQRYTEISARAKSAPLAICIASLKARESAPA